MSINQTEYKIEVLKYLDLWFYLKLYTLKLIINPIIFVVRLIGLHDFFKKIIKPRFRYKQSQMHCPFQNLLHNSNLRGLNQHSVPIRVAKQASCPSFERLLCAPDVGAADMEMSPNQKNAITCEVVRKIIDFLSNRFF